MPTPTPFRVDRFVVPQQAMPMFLARLQETQRRLDELPGCRQNVVLKRAGESGDAEVVTIVEWASTEAMQHAKSAMQARYELEGFDPASFMNSLGVQADMGTWLPA